MTYILSPLTMGAETLLKPRPKSITRAIVYPVEIAPPSGTVTFDAVGPSSAGQGGAGVASITWTHTAVATGVAVLVCASCGADGATLSATYGGTAMTSLGKVHSNNSTGGFAELFGIANRSSGAATVVVSSTITGDLTGGSISLAGALTASPFNTAVTSFGNTATPSATISTTTSGNMCVGVAANGSSITSATAPSTSRYIQNLSTASGAGNSAGATSPSTGSSVTMAWAVTSDWWGVVAVEVKAAPASQNFTGTVDLSGSGTLSLAGVPNPIQTVGLSGSGTLSLAGVPSPTGAVGLSGNGTLTRILSAGYEGQTNGVAISAANSDDFGDSPVRDVVPGTSGTINYSSTQKMHGALGLEFAGATTATSVNYDAGLSDDSFSARFYTYWGSYPSPERQGPCDIRTGANTGICRLQTATTGRVKVLNTAGTQVAITTAAPSLNTWYRWEFSGKVLNTAVTELTLSYYVGDSTTPVETISATAVTTTGLPRFLNIGFPSASTAGQTVYFDDVAFAVGRFDPLGPAVAGNDFTGSVGLSGSGTLTLAGTPAIPGAGGLNGAGTLTLAGTPNIVGTAGLSGTGTLTLAGTPKPIQTVGLSGTGTLTLAGSPNIVGTVGLSGDGTLAGFSGGGQAALSGSGTLTGAGTPAITSSVALTGSGTLSGAGSPAVAGSVALAGTGTLTLAGKPTPVAALSLSGAGTLAGTAPLITLSGTAQFSGNGTLTFTPAGILSLSGSGTLTLTGIPTPNGVVGLSGSGTLVFSAAIPRITGATVGFTGIGSLNFSGAKPGISGICSLSGNGVLTLTAIPKPSGTVGLNGAGLLALLTNVAQTGFVVAGIETSPVVRSGIGSSVTAVSGNSTSVTVIGGGQ